MRPSLLVKGLFNVAGFFLNLPAEFFVRSLDFEVRILDRATDFLFNGAFHFVRAALDFILRAVFHLFYELRCCRHTPEHVAGRTPRR
jgi:hypothetical protein